MGHALSAKKNNSCRGESISQTVSRKQRKLCEISNNKHRLDTDDPVVQADTMALVAFYAHILHEYWPFSTSQSHFIIISLMLVMINDRKPPCILEMCTLTGWCKHCAIYTGIAWIRLLPAEYFPSAVKSCRHALAGHLPAQCCSCPASAVFICLPESSSSSFSKL